MSETIYCVYETTYSGNKLPPKYEGGISPSKYVGSSSVDKVEKGYRGSVASKKYKAIWDSELKESPHLFSSEILKIQPSREEATAEELQIQKENDVVKNPEYVNMSYATIKGYCGMNTLGENNPHWGKTKENDEVTRLSAEKISIARKKFCDENPEAHPMLGVPGWNIGLSKETSEGVRIQSEKLKAFHATEEGKKSLAQGMITRKLKDEEDPSRIEKRKQKSIIAQENRCPIKKAAGAAKTSAKLKGKTKSEEHIRKMRKLSDEEELQVILWFEQGNNRTEIVRLLKGKVSISPVARIIDKYLKNKIQEI